MYNSKNLCSIGGESMLETIFIGVLVGSIFGAIRDKEKRWRGAVKFGIFGFFVALIFIILKILKATGNTSLAVLIGALIGGLSGVISDKKNRWRGVVIRGAIGALAFWLATLL